jgi:1-acyl-sn-glycerol-3-phosphate acyltransferase
MPQELWVQPVTVVYQAPKDKDARFYGWYGTMDFAPHLLVTLAQRPQGHVTVTLHPPLRVADYPSRKELSTAAEAAVRSAHRGKQSL